MPPRAGEAPTSCLVTGRGLPCCLTPRKCVAQSPPSRSITSRRALPRPTSSSHGRHPSCRLRRMTELVPSRAGLQDHPDELLLKPHTPSAPPFLPSHAHSLEIAKTPKERRPP